MFNISKRIAMKKIKALANALAAVGIESDIYEDEEHGMISLSTNLWNCVDGSSVLFEVYADSEDNYTFDSYAEPENDRKRFLEELNVIVENWEE